MPTTLTITPSPLVWTSVVTTQINGLANTTGAIGSTVIDNTSGTPATGIIFEADLASLTPASGGYLVPFLVPENADQGGTYIVDAEAIAAWQNYVHAIISLEAVVGTQRQMSRSVMGLLPMKYKVGLVSYAGVTLAASGNIIRAATFNHQTV
jgi:hypothetical protein